MITWKKFVDWNKKVFNDPEPGLAYAYAKDDQGNLSFKFSIFGSHFESHRRVENQQQPRRRVKEIEAEECQLIE